MSTTGTCLNIVDTINFKICDDDFHSPSPSLSNLSMLKWYANAFLQSLEIIPSSVHMLVWLADVSCDNSNFGISNFGLIKDEYNLLSPDIYNNISPLRKYMNNSCMMNNTILDFMQSPIGIKWPCIFYQIGKTINQNNQNQPELWKLLQVKVSCTHIFIELFHWF